MSRGRALSVAKPAAGSGLKDAAQRNAAVKAGDRAQRRSGKMGAQGEEFGKFWAHVNPKFYPPRAGDRAQRRSGKMARKVRNLSKFWSYMNPKFYPQRRATGRSGALASWRAR